jgi:glyoxylase-like metal-dependent hydrolase (beta-lactamase superfamily II)
MRRIVTLGLLVGIGGLVTVKSQQTRPPIAKIEKVKDNLYFIANSGPPPPVTTFTGGNTAVFVMDRGVALVDTKLPGYGADILAQVRSVTDKPVVTIINTHTHNDHSGSNTEFPASVEFVVHENTRANMAKATCPPVTNCQSFKGENAKYLPKRTFKDKLTLGAGKNQIDLYYFGRGHTNGDAWVVFPSLQVVHTGDMFQHKRMPFIDTQNNDGSAVEWIETQEKARKALQPHVNTILPGHEPRVMTWDNFTEDMGFYRDFLGTVRAAMQAGESADATIAAYKPPDKYKHYAVDPTRLKGNVESIYKELSVRR